MKQQLGAFNLVLNSGQTTSADYKSNSTTIVPQRRMIRSLHPSKSQHLLKVWISGNFYCHTTWFYCLCLNLDSVVFNIPGKVSGYRCHRVIYVIVIWHVLSLENIFYIIPLFWLSSFDFHLKHAAAYFISRATLPVFEFPDYLEEHAHFSKIKPGKVDTFDSSCIYCYSLCTYIFFHFQERMKKNPALDYE